MDPHLDQSWRAVPVPWQKRWGRRLFYLILLLGAVLVAGMAYEPAAEAFQLRNSPPPGRVIQANGLDMHLQVVGQPSSPVIVFFNGWGLPSSSWSWILAETSQRHMVVRWDPPGYAWSALGTGGFDASSQVDRIHSAMKTYEVNGPYLLVGTGLGALEAEAFAVRYPDEVAGMVLLDPWHPSLMSGVSDQAAHLDREATLRRFSWHRFKAWWKKTPEPAFGLPPNDATALYASLRTMKLARAQEAELRALPESFAQVQPLQTFGQKPLTILTSAALDEDGSDGPWASGSQAARQQLDEQFSKISLYGKHLVVAGATPRSLLCRREHSDQVSDAIRMCLEH